MTFRVDDVVPAAEPLPVRPVAGWHLTSAEVEIDDVIDRIVADHRVTAPSPEAG